MPILKDYQEKAVTRLLDYTCDALGLPDRRIQMVLKAPTGAGKTVTMAAYLSRLIQEVTLRPNLPRDIAIIWIAPNTLHLQSYHSLKGFYSELNDLKTVQINDLSGNVELRPKDLLFINWSSVDKEKNTFRKENERSFNLETLILNTRLQNIEIIAVIDEAHLSAFTGEQAKNVLKLIDAKIEISVTATPLHIPDRNVVIQRQEVVASQMIKKGVRLNVDLSEEEQKGLSLDLHLLQKAMSKRQEAADAYEAAGININPLLLVQLPSEKATLTDEDRTKRKIIEEHLESEFGITTRNNLLAIWLSDSSDKINLYNLEHPAAMQRVLIFKQAISQGWDCPRAAVLIIFREIGNPTFGIQTVGRILRMPEQKHYSDDFLNYGYVYTNLQNSVIRFLPDNEDYFSKQRAVFKKGLSNHQLQSSYIVNDRPSLGFLSSDFLRIFNHTVESLYEISEIPEAHLFNSIEEAEIKAITEKNRKEFAAKFWDLQVEEIEISIPKDIYVDAYDVNTILVNNDKIGHFSKTQAELNEMLERFCYDSVSVLNKSKSWKLLKRTLIEFVEYYMSYDEFTARKILLHAPNQKLLTEIITISLENYDKWQKEKGNKNRREETSVWQVPEERFYSEIFHRQEKIKFHALEPFFEFNNASTPEKIFQKLLEDNYRELEWWYKNGDKGREHFAVSYTNSANELSLFFVDFIVKFSADTFGLFDTKTKGSDPEASRKHNALLDYIANINKRNPDRSLIGGILIPESKGNDILFRYCRDKIENTSDLTGWDYFNPSVINKR